MNPQALPILVAPMDLAYAEHLAPELVCELERTARWIGLPLRELELLGQDPEHARAFVRAVDRGEHQAFLDDVDWRVLESLLYAQQTPHVPSGSGPYPVTAN